MSHISLLFCPNAQTLFPVVIIQQHYRLHHVSEHHHCHPQHGYVTKTRGSCCSKPVRMPTAACLTCLCTDREIQLPGHQYRGSEQRERGRGDLHRLHHEGGSGGCGWTHRARRHAVAGVPCGNFETLLHTIVMLCLHLFLR